MLNHTMPVVKMERLPTTMSAKNNAPTLHVSTANAASASNHKPAHNSSSSNAAAASNSSPTRPGASSNTKEHRDKSKMSSTTAGSHLSKGNEHVSRSSLDEIVDRKSKKPVEPDAKKSSKESSAVDKVLEITATRLSDDEDTSLSALKSRLKSESSSSPHVQSKAKLSDSSSGKHNDVEKKHDVLNSSASSGDTSPLRKHGSHHHHHGDGTGSKSSKHRHSSHIHSTERNSNSSSRHSKHSEHSSSEGSKSGKQGTEKLHWGSSGKSKSPETHDSSVGKHGSTSSRQDSNSSKLNEKRDSSSFKDRESHISKGNNSGKEISKMANASKPSTGILSDVKSSGISKLTGRSMTNEIDAFDFAKGEESTEKKHVDVSLDAASIKYNGTPVLSSSSFSSTAEESLTLSTNDNNNSRIGKQGIVVF